MFQVIHPPPPPQKNNSCMHSMPMFINAKALEVHSCDQLWYESNFLLCEASVNLGITKSKCQVNMVQKLLIF